jgi:hypothetical protein
MFCSRSMPRIAAGLLLVTLACEGRSPAAPGRQLAANTDVADAHRSNGDVKGHVVQCAPHAAVTGRGVFGPSGGELIVGDSRLLIPGGALRDTVTITGTALGDGTSTVDFEPHGLQFRKPAQLVLSGEGCTMPQEGDASIVYLGPAGEVLETIPAIYLPRWKLVGAPIQHFSGYAILF